MPTEKKIRVAIVDAGRGRGTPGMVLDAVASRYNIEETKDYDADYVFHSCMGYDVLKYSGVRIFVTGENVAPNFNISDYAMSFERMNYCDRSCWLPLLRLYNDAYQFLKQPRRPAEEVSKGKNTFCAYTVSNLDDSSYERIEIFEKLNAYRTVQSGGKWRNNVGGRVDDKIAFQSKAKFVIAFENHSHPGYLTEKFAEAAQSNAVPIYWGDPRIADFFNPKAFVNCHAFKDIESVVDEVIAIDQDEQRYLNMLNEPWFENEQEPEVFTNAYYEAFLDNIFDVPLEQAYRRNRGRWGLKYERALRTMAFHPAKQLAILTKIQIRKWKGSR